MRTQGEPAAAARAGRLRPAANGAPRRRRTPARASGKRRAAARCRRPRAVPSDSRPSRQREADRNRLFNTDERINCSNSATFPSVASARAAADASGVWIVGSCPAMRAPASLTRRLSNRLSLFEYVDAAIQTSTPVRISPAKSTPSGSQNGQRPPCAAALAPAVSCSPSVPRACSALALDTGPLSVIATPASSRGRVSPAARARRTHFPSDRSVAAVFPAVLQPVGAHPATTHSCAAGTEESNI